MTLKQTNEETLMTHKFKSFDAASSFCKAIGFKHDVKPYRRLLWVNGVQITVWCVPAPIL